jgi:SAM-dependent methyltransferase
MISGLRWYDGKKMVAFVRGGDYAHPGDETLIDTALGKFPKDRDRIILDIGCGLGGTAQYIQKQGWGKVTGVDIEESSIIYAKKTYPEIEFYTSDVVKTSEVLSDKRFDLICLFNSFYSFPDQLGALKGLRKVAKKDADLIIFEYTDLSNSKSRQIQIDDKSLFSLPIDQNNFKNMLTMSNWRYIDSVSLDKECENWYMGFIKNFKRKRRQIIKNFGIDMYKKGYDRYSGICDAFRNKMMGASIFYARCF